MKLYSFTLVSLTKVSYVYFFKLFENKKNYKRLECLTELSIFFNLKLFWKQCFPNETASRWVIEKDAVNKKFKAV